MNRSPLKKQLKAKKAASRAINQIRVKKHGYRKLVIGELVFNWRYYDGSYPSPRVEIRAPGNVKWLVPIWELQGLKSWEEWRKKHEDCINDDYEHCGADSATPGMVRNYIDGKRSGCVLSTGE